MGQHRVRHGSPLCQARTVRDLPDRIPAEGHRIHGRSDGSDCSCRAYTTHSAIAQPDRRADLQRWDDRRKFCQLQDVLSHSGTGWGGSCTGQNNNHSSSSTGASTSDTDTSTSGVGSSTGTTSISSSSTAKYAESHNCSFIGTSTTTYRAAATSFASSVS